MTEQKLIMPRTIEKKELNIREMSVNNIAAMVQRIDQQNLILNQIGQVLSNLTNNIAVFIQKQEASSKIKSFKDIISKN